MSEDIEAVIAQRDALIELVRCLDEELEYGPNVTIEQGKRSDAARTRCRELGVET